jgi:hypothetical protein
VAGRNENGRDRHTLFGSMEVEGGCALLLPCRTPQELEDRVLYLSSALGFRPVPAALGPRTIALHACTNAELAVPPSSASDEEEDEAEEDGSESGWVVVSGDCALSEPVLVEWSYSVAGRMDVLDHLGVEYDVVRSAAGVASAAERQGRGKGRVVVRPLADEVEERLAAERKGKGSGGGEVASSLAQRQRLAEVWAESRDAAAEGTAGLCYRSASGMVVLCVRISARADMPALCRLGLVESMPELLPSFSAPFSRDNADRALWDALERVGRGAGVVGETRRWSEAELERCERVVRELEGSRPLADSVALRRSLGVCVGVLVAVDRARVADVVDWWGRVGWGTVATAKDVAPFSWTLVSNGSGMIAIVAVQDLLQQPQQPPFPTTSLLFLPTLGLEGSQRQLASTTELARTAEGRGVLVVGGRSEGSGPFVVAAVSDDATGSVDIVLWASAALLLALLLITFYLLNTSSSKAAHRHALPPLPTFQDDEPARTAARDQAYDDF